MLLIVPIFAEIDVCKKKLLQYAVILSSCKEFTDKMTAKNDPLLMEQLLHG